MINLFGIKKIMIVLVPLGFGAAIAITQTLWAQSPLSWGPQWRADGKVKLPENYHYWIFLGSPLTPHALNGGKAGFPEYHNVYVQPEALAVYRGTGE
jgi:hypothetical protein